LTGYEAKHPFIDVDHHRHRHRKRGLYNPGTRRPIRSRLDSDLIANGLIPTSMPVKTNLATGPKHLRGPTRGLPLSSHDQINLALIWINVWQRLAC
jgi:hypothetical protein